MSQNIYKSEKKKEKGETRKDKRGNERGESNEVNLHDLNMQAMLVIAAC